MPFNQWMIQPYINDNIAIGFVARLMEANKHRFRRCQLQENNA